MRMCNLDDPLMKKQEEEEPDLNETELAALEEMEDQRIQFLQLYQKGVKDILEFKDMLVNLPTSNVTKVKWDAVIEFSKELHKAAPMSIFFKQLTQIVKMAHGAMVKEERCLRICIGRSVEAIVQLGLDLVSVAGTPCESDEERRWKTVKLVARFLDSLDDLKKTPTNNIAALQIELLRVTAETCDIVKEWKKLKKSPREAAGLPAYMEKKIELLNGGTVRDRISKLIIDKRSQVFTDMVRDSERAVSSKKELKEDSFDPAVLKMKIVQWSNDLSPAILWEIEKFIRGESTRELMMTVAEIIEFMNVRKASDLFLSYLEQMLCIIHQFMMKKDEKGVAVVFECLVELCQETTSNAKEALVNTQDTTAFKTLLDQADKAMGEIKRHLDSLDAWDV